MLFKIILYLLVSLINVGLSSGDYQRFLQSTPNSFGLLMLANIQQSQKQLFLQELNKYASMDCQDMTSVSVIWANAELPEKFGVKILTNWKRPIYFVNNSKSRLSIAQESNQKVYFSINYDSNVKCPEMAQAFLEWKQKAVGDIAPIMSFQMGGFDINSRKQRLTFNGNVSLYSIGMLEKSFISAFFIHLYNSKKLWEVTKMRESVGYQIACEDIALNYLVSYYFSQLIPKSLKTSFQSNRPANQNQQNYQSTTSQCLTNLILVLGYCPVRIVHNQDENGEKFKSAVANYSIYLKRKQLQQILEIKSLPQQKKQNKVPQIGKESIEKQNRKQKLKDQKQLIKVRLESAKEQKKRLQDSINKIKNYESMPTSITEKLDLKKHTEAVSGLYSIISIIEDEGIAVFIMLLLMIVYTVIKYFCGSNKSKQINQKYSETKTRDESNEVINQFEDDDQKRVQQKSSLN